MKKFLGIFALLSILTLSGCSMTDNESETRSINNNQEVLNIINVVPADSEAQIEKNNTSTHPILDNPELTTCDFWIDKNYARIDSYNNTKIINENAGNLTVSGKIVQRTDSKSYDEAQQSTKVYLEIANPTNDAQQEFFDYYAAKIVNGNGINKIEEQKLLFGLGVLENAQLITSADLDEELKNLIISTIDTNNILELNLTIPIYVGGGVGDGFSFACKISQND